MNIEKQNISSIRYLFVISGEGTKLEGETCGPCFNPRGNFTCGTCVEGLECVPHENVDLIPDLPSLCRAPQSKITTGIFYKEIGK